MTAKRALGLLMALFALMAAPVATLAQDNTAAPAAAAPAEGATADAPPVLPWVKYCGDLEDGRKLCLVRQLLFTNNKLLARMIIRNNPAEEMPLLLMASMPTGVSLPYGMRFQIDNGRELTLPYLNCDAEMCNVRSVVNEAFIASMKRGNTLKLKAKNSRGVDVVLEIDLKGFTATWDGDQYVALGEQNAQQPDVNAADKLGQAVQDLAEQIRRDKTDTETTTDQPAADQ